MRQAAATAHIKLKRSLKYQLQLSLVSLQVLIHNKLIVMTRVICIYNYETAQASHDAAATSSLSSFSWSLGITYFAYSLAANRAPTNGPVHQIQWCSQNLQVRTQLNTAQICVTHRHFWSRFHTLIQGEKRASLYVGTVSHVDSN